MTPARPRVLATAAHIQRRPQPCAEAGRLTMLPRPSLRFLFRFPLPLLFRFRLLSRLSLPEQGTDDNSAFPVIAEAVSLRAVNSGGRGKSLVLKGPALPPTPWMLTGD
ncbi:unnamed protein product [Rangifer tarandus platyrhynchus]|uniref:Uncharacterized protein n=1 Tax=Rangifer tarandus platyrhynchus TaxID=3082113 RepID=A0AC59YS20_RANTA